MRPHTARSSFARIAGQVVANDSIVRTPACISEEDACALARTAAEFRVLFAGRGHPRKRLGKKTIRVVRKANSLQRGDEVLARDKDRIQGAQFAFMSSNLIPWRSTDQRSRDGRGVTTRLQRLREGSSSIHELSQF